MQRQLKRYRKFWEELITHFPLIAILALDTSRKKTLVCSGIQVTLWFLPQQFARLQCWHY
jgi:hypothetical protein